MDKAQLRKKMIAIRKQFAGKEEASEIIIQHILDLPEWKQAKIVCIYSPFSSDVDTAKLFKLKHVVKPEEANQTTIDLYIVPGVAFDKNGNRLGRGRGYYDRLLANVTVPKIGLAFEIQMVAQVPTTSYDVPMTVVVTEKATFLCRPGRSAGSARRKYGKTKTS